MVSMSTLSLRYRFIYINFLYVTFFALCTILWANSHNIRVYFNSVKSEKKWTPLYNRADRLLMPNQFIPGLGGGFQLNCSLDLPCIGFGSPWFGDYKGWEFFAKSFSPEECPSRCHFVSDVSQADAVVFHGRDLAVKPPNWRRHSRQVWIYLNLESPQATSTRGLNVAAHLAYHTLFNWTVTYMTGSVARASYGFTEARHQPIVPQLPNLTLKKRLAYIVFSNCKYTYNNRAHVVRRLQAVMELDVYGSCGSLMLPNVSNAFQQLSKKYYFYLSFENALCKEYITEKFFRNALNTDAAPVAIGGLSRRDYEVLAPPNSFVYGPDFKTSLDLANHLRQMAANTKAYLALFAWRSTHRVRKATLFCETCMTLHSGVSVNSSRSAAQLAEYYSVDRNCKPTSYNYLV